RLLLIGAGRYSTDHDHTFDGVRLNIGHARAVFEIGHAPLELIALVKNLVDSPDQIDRWRMDAAAINGAQEFRLRRLDLEQSHVVGEAVPVKKVSNFVTDAGEGPASDRHLPAQSHDRQSSEGGALLALSRFGRKCGKSPIEFTELFRLVLADFSPMQQC